MIEVVNTSNSTGSRSVLVASAFFAAVGLFVAIPLIQLVSTGFKSPTDINSIDMSLAPPKLMEIDVPPPPEDDQEEEDIEMDKEPPKLSLDQLDLALNPSTSSISGGFALDLSLDADSLGTDDLIFEIGDVEEKPNPVKQIPPTYPPSLKRQKIKGTVVVMFVVDKNGNVIAPKVERSTHPDFNRPALDAIRRWKFTPGKKAGEAVKVRVRIPLVFQI